MGEHPVNDTEEAARRLLAVAAEDVPAGIDLLRGVRSRRRKRAVRLRAVVAAGAAGIVAAAAAVTLSAVQAPSAYAQVIQAAARTAAASYRVRAVEHIVRDGGLPSQPWSTASGQFDPADGLGELTTNLGAQIRYAGGYTYELVTGTVRAGARAQGTPIPAWASWERLPIRLGASPEGNPTAPFPVRVTRAGLALLRVSSAFLGQAGPQDLLVLLRSAAHVRVAGPASGPGWTGAAYTFSAATSLTEPVPEPVSISGTVDVDQQGLVRQLDAVESFDQTVRKIKTTFGDFGLTVSVSPPSASVTYIPPGG
jgi:hypothetical protein